MTEETTTRTNGSVRTLILGAVCIAVLVGAWLYKQKTANDLAAVDKDTAPADRTPSNAPFIKTVDVVVEKMIEVAQISEDDLVYDLGCGDGKIVIAAAEKTGCRGLGLEIDPEIVLKAEENAKLHNVSDRVTIRQQDVFEADLKDADCVVMFLLPWMIEKLIPQFQELKPGTRIVSHNFGFGGNIDDIPPDERYEVQVPGSGTDWVYVWVTPLKIPADYKSQSK